MKPDPHDMALAFQRGEEEAFTFFFDELYENLLYYGNRILKDRVLTEDVVSESFIKIWDRRGMFNHHKVIKSWLYTTVRNGCINRAIQDARKEKRIDDYATSIAGKIQAAHDENIIHAEVIGEIHEVLKVLPGHCRRIFELMYVHGKTAKQISGQLHLHISTVKNQKMRGLKLIRQRCGDLSGLGY